MAKKVPPILTCLEDLEEHDKLTDLAICGVDLSEPYLTRYRTQGAHDPTPTPYFLLEHLFKYFSFDEDSHLLDVGCGTGRVLAYYLQQRYPGRATGVELDPHLAHMAQDWTARHANLQVLEASALDIDLRSYTDFYLFNPFDPSVLQQFIEQLEAQLWHPFTLVHMSDNGDTWRYEGRAGWTQVTTGQITGFVNALGRHIKIFDWPQHYSVWRYDPDL